MKYLKLNNGKEIPALGFGTWDLRGTECEKCILDAIEVGYRLIDTAQMYGNEKEIGNALKKTSVPREELFITSKVCRPNNSYQGTKDAIQTSLSNLQLDYIDLYLIHEPYRESKEMYRALQESYEAGLIKAVGISNFNISLYNNLIKSCDIIPAINQVEAHVYFQQTKLHEVLQKHGTIMEAWSPFTAGRRNVFKDYTLLEIASKHNKTVAQIILRFFIQNNIIAIPKSSHKHRMEENMDVFDFNLDTDDINKIIQLDQNKTLFGWY